MSEAAPATGELLARLVAGRFAPEALAVVCPSAAWRPSGMGEYHGSTGFDTFSKRKAVFRASRFGAAKLLRPPCGRRFDALVRWLTG